jgi:hypothetical protein
MRSTSRARRERLLESLRGVREQFELDGAVYPFHSLTDKGPASSFRNQRLGDKARNGPGRLGPFSIPWSRRRSSGSIAWGTLGELSPQPRRRSLGYCRCGTGFPGDRRCY